MEKESSESAPKEEAGREPPRKACAPSASGGMGVEVIRVREVRQTPLWETFLFALLCILLGGAAWYLRTQTPQPPELETAARTGETR